MSSPVERAADRLKSRLPDAHDIRVDGKVRGTLSVALKLANDNHGFTLHRENGSWKLRDWVINESRVDADTVSLPYFDDVIVQLLKPHTAPPKINVVDLRCPEKHRQLFAKLIVQSTAPSDQPSNLIEFLCPWCKRTNGVLTYHYYNSAGRLVKTDRSDPYVPRQPKTHPIPEAVEPPHDNHSPKEVSSAHTNS